MWIRMNKTVFNSIEILNKLDRFVRYAVRRPRGDENKSEIRRAQPPVCGCSLTTQLSRPDSVVWRTSPRLRIDFDTMTYYIASLIYTS